MSNVVCCTWHQRLVRKAQLGQSGARFSCCKATESTSSNLGTSAVTRKVMTLQQDAASCSSVLHDAASQGVTLPAHLSHLSQRPW